MPESLAHFFIFENCGFLNMNTAGLNRFKIWLLTLKKFFRSSSDFDGKRVIFWIGLHRSAATSVKHCRFLI